MIKASSPASLTRRRLLTSICTAALLTRSVGSGYSQVRTNTDTAPPTPPPAGASGRFASPGAGGLVFNQYIDPISGQRFCWTDTFGGYVWEPRLGPNGSWREIGGYAQGCILNNPAFHCSIAAIVSAETDNNRWYAATIVNASPQQYQLSRSDDRCATRWVQPPSNRMFHSNGATRGHGLRLLVDPYNKDVVIFGAPYSATSPNKGVWISRDGLATAPTKISSVPDPTSDGPTGGTVSPGAGCLVIFDRSGGTTTVGGKTVCKNVFATSAGNGLYRSTDGAQTFSLVPGSASALISQMDIINGGTYAGNLWAVSNNTAVYNYNSVNGFSAKTIPAPGGTQPSHRKGDLLPRWFVTCNQDPAKSGEMIFVGLGAASYVTMTTDNLNSTVISVPGGGQTYVISDPYWWYSDFTASKDEPAYLPFTCGLGPGGAFYCLTGAWDPLTGDYFVHGNQSIWRATIKPKEFLTRPAGVNLLWKSESRGIQNTVMCDFLRPPGTSKPWLLAVQDQGIMNAGATSTDFAKAFYTNNARGVLANCEFVDYATNDPSFILAPNNLTMAKSTNWGDTFSNSGPPTRFNRNVCAAAASSTNWVATGFAFDEANNRPQYTTDGGASWNDSAGFPIGGHSSSFFFPVRNIAADRGNVGTFYGFARGVGVYRSTDGGANFSAAPLKGLAPFAKLLSEFTFLRSVHGKAGHFIITFAMGSPDRSYIASNDGGNTGFSQVIGGGRMVYMLGIGGTKPGANYPRIWALTNISRGVNFGIHYTDNFDVLFSGGSPTWNLVTNLLNPAGGVTSDLGLFTNCGFLGLRGLNGDPNDYSKALLGTFGYGCFEIVVP